MSASEELNPVFKECIKLLDESEKIYGDTWKLMTPEEIQIAITHNVNHMKTAKLVTKQIKDARDAINYLAMWIHCKERK